MFAANPARRLRALGELAREQDQQRTLEATVAVPILPARGAAAFAQLVADHLEGPALRYSRRIRLLREAQRRGIGRFEANLIIAAVQHRAGESREVESVGSPQPWRGALLTF